MAMHLSTRRWQDQGILLLALWLVASPWVMAYPSASQPAVNATIAGIIMAALAAFDLYKTYAWAVFLNIILGIWVAVSPWMVNVMRDRAMSASMLLVGLATIVLGLWELRTDPELHQQWAGV